MGANRPPARAILRTRRDRPVNPGFVGSVAWLVASCALGITGGLHPGAADAQPASTIQSVKGSVVAIGTFQTTRVPQFRFLGTGFAVGDGSLAATNAHVIPAALDPGADPEVLVALLPGGEPTRLGVRKLTRVAIDSRHDVALMKMDGPALRPLALRDSSTVAEGDQLLFTGFPIGGVLGLFPATHRAMVAAIAPIAMPSASGQKLDPRVVRRLRDDAFSVFQLDATAFPGNSGSPLYDPGTGEVVGVLNMVFVKATKESALSQPSGISYAIPSRFLIDLLAQARR
jgi:S1-C subfamily serine protease